MIAVGSAASSASPLRPPTPSRTSTPRPASPHLRAVTRPFSVLVFEPVHLIMQTRQFRNLHSRVAAEVSHSLARADAFRLTVDEAAKAPCHRLTDPSGRWVLPPRSRSISVGHRTQCDISQRMEIPRDFRSPANSSSETIGDSTCSGRTGDRDASEVYEPVTNPSAGGQRVLAGMVGKMGG